MALIGWVETATARTLWPDAPKVDTTLDRYLAAAHRQLVGYAPALPVEDPPVPAPDDYQLAQVLQARALWTASRRDGDVLGFDDGSAVRVRPLDSTVKSLLRPPRAGGAVG